MTMWRMTHEETELINLDFIENMYVERKKYAGCDEYFQINAVSSDRLYILSKHDTIKDAEKSLRTIYQELNKK